jgi:hypothetical protein
VRWSGFAAAHRQVAPVADAPVAADLLQALDVHRHLAPQIALDPVVAVDDLTQLCHLDFGQIPDTRVGADLGLLEDPLLLVRPIP